MVKVCREQWLLLTEVAPGAEVIWPDELGVGLVVPLRNARATRRTRALWRGITLLSVGSLRLWQLSEDHGSMGHPGLHQFGFGRGQSVDDALQVTRRLVEKGCCYQH